MKKRLWPGRHEPQMVQAMAKSLASETARDFAKRMWDKIVKSGDSNGTGARWLQFVGWDVGGWLVCEWSRLAPNLKDDLVKSVDAFGRVITEELRKNPVLWADYQHILKRASR